jgi:integrase
MAKRLPMYSLHKATGQARVWLNGKDHYLGAYGSRESHVRYGELMKQFATGVVVDPILNQNPADTGPTVNELALAYVCFAKTHYRKNGKPTAEFDCIKSAIKPLVNLFGSTPAKSFGPAALKATRQKMVDGGTWCRSYINKSVGRIRRVFRWGVEGELVPSTVLLGLEAVSPLLAGRTTATDHAPRTAISVDHLERVRNKVGQRTRDMIDIAVLTGCRPGELCSLTAEMIDVSDPTAWVASLADHKNSHRGKSRSLVFGEKSQAILKKYLVKNKAATIFKIQRATFSNQLKKACDDLNLPRFTGHWLRHQAASEIRETHGLDGVQASLGHATVSQSDHYAHVSLDKAKEVARNRG